MRFWFFSAGPNRTRRPAPSVRPLLEPLEDRWLPSANVMPVSTPPTNPIASLSHDQVHMLQDQSQQQSALATFHLEVEQVVLGLVRQFAPQAPQFQPLIATLTSDIPKQQAIAQTLQNQTNLLNQLDDVQDQSLILSGVIQKLTPLVPALQQFGNRRAANAVENIIAADQATVQMLQPQIDEVEVEVSAFA